MPWKRITTFATVNSCEERYKDAHVSGVGKDAVMTKISLGWYMTLKEWPHTSIYLGSTDPELVPGNNVVIDIRRVMPVVVGGKKEEVT